MRSSPDRLVKQSPLTWITLECLTTGARAVAWIVFTKEEQCFHWDYLSVSAELTVLLAGHLHTHTHRCKTS